MRIALLVSPKIPNESLTHTDTLIHALLQEHVACVCACAVAKSCGQHACHATDM